MSDDSTLCVTATGIAGAAVTLTLPAVAGKFHHITALELTLYATAARTGGATALSVTSTNLSGSPTWIFDTAQAIGTVIRNNLLFPDAKRSSAQGTDTTIVAPAATSGIWRLTAHYYAAA